MKNELPSQTLSDVAQAWKSGNLSPRCNTFKRVAATIVGKNTGASVSKNRPVVITGFSLDLPYAKAYNNMVNDTLRVKFRAAGSTDEVTVMTTEPIKRGCFGSLSADVIFGVVQFTDTAHKYATAALASASTGAYKIVARSGFNNNLAVCAMIKVNGESKEVQLDLQTEQFIKTVQRTEMDIHTASHLTDLSVSHATNATGVTAITSVTPVKGGSITSETGTAVTSVTPTSGSAVGSVSPSMTSVVASIETTPASFVTEVATSSEQFVDDVTSEDSKFLTGITPAHGNFITEVTSQDGNFLTEVKTTDATVITEVKTTDGQFVDNVSTTPETVAKTIKTTPTQVVGSVTTTDGDAVTSVTGQEVRVLTKVTPRSGQVIKKVNFTPAQVVTDVTPREIATFVQTLNAPTGTFAKDLATMQKTVVTSASLVLDQNAAGGGIQIVTGVECVNNRIEVSTAYIRLSVQTEVVNTVQSFTPSPAVTGVTITKTDTAIKSVNVPKENFVKDISPEPEFAVLELKTEDAKSMVNIQAPTAKFIATVTPTDKTVLESASVDQQAEVIKTVSPHKASALVSAEGTPGTAVGSITPTPGKALISVTGTPGQAITSITPADGKALTKITSSKKAALVSATGTTESGIASVEATPTQVVESVDAPTTSVVTSIEAPTSSFITTATLDGEIVTDIETEDESFQVYTFEERTIPIPTFGEVTVVRSITPTYGNAVTDVTLR